jgi:hypothetical protein
MLPKLTEICETTFIYCHVFSDLDREFGLVIGFIYHL